MAAAQATITKPAVSFSLKNILLATDFSAGSQTALKYARALAREEAAEIHALHVNAPDSYQLLSPDALAITFDRYSEDCLQATEMLQRLMTGLPPQMPLRTGRIWEVVEDIVARNEIDLLVQATHGRTGLPRMIHGSVAEELFRNVSCPVLTVGPEVKAQTSSDLKIRNILLATDFDEHSSAPSYAGWLANEFNANLTVLYVTRKVGNSDQNLAKFRIELEDLGLRHEPEFIVRDGAPVTEILQAAWEQRPDIIVLGAHHPEPARIVSHWPWDTVATVVAQVKCPVLSYRERGENWGNIYF
jgi:nucleotide-binding universal stress UspA family protein